MQKLEKEMDKFEKKWKTSFTSLDTGAPLSSYVGVGGLYAKLKLSSRYIEFSPYFI